MRTKDAGQCWLHNLTSRNLLMIPSSQWSHVTVLHGHVVFTWRGSSARLISFSQPSFSHLSNLNSQRDATWFWGGSKWVGAQVARNAGEINEWYGDEWEGKPKRRLSNLKKRQDLMISWCLRLWGHSFSTKHSRTYARKYIKLPAYMPILIQHWNHSPLVLLLFVSSIVPAAKAAPTRRLSHHKVVKKPPATSQFWFEPGRQSLLAVTTCFINHASHRDCCNCTARVDICKTQVQICEMWVDICKIWVEIFARGTSRHTLTSCNAVLSMCEVKMATRWLPNVADLFFSLARLIETSDQTRIILIHVVELFSRLWSR